MNFFGIGLPEMAVIAAIGLLVFGPKRLPELGRTLGRTLKGFQSASREFEQEFRSAIDTETATLPASAPPPAEAGLAPAEVAIALAPEPVREQPVGSAQASPAAPIAAAAEGTGSAESTAPAGATVPAGSMAEPSGDMAAEAVPELVAEVVVDPPVAG